MSVMEALEERLKHPAPWGLWVWVYGIRPELWGAAMESWDRHKHRLDKPYLITLIDYGLPSDRRRLWTLDFTEPFPVLRCHALVSHGKNSGRQIVTSVSNVKESNQSCVGGFVTLHTRTSKAGQKGGARKPALVIDGLDSTNDNAKARYIIMHGAKYVTDTGAGRSLGCPALKQEVNDDLVELIKGGSFLYSYWTQDAAP